MDDIFAYNQVKHKKYFDSLSLVRLPPALSEQKLSTSSRHIGDVYDPEGITRHILGYELKIDTGISKGVCYRLSRYGHYKGEIIMKHFRALLDNTWIRKYITWSYGAPIVLAPKSNHKYKRLLTENMR